MKHFKFNVTGHIILNNLPKTAQDYIVDGTNRENKQKNKHKVLGLPSFSNGEISFSVQLNSQTQQQVFQRPWKYSSEH